MPRRIDFGLSTKTYHFTSNYVSTTRYKLWNIVPLNLFEQFHRIANIWFLIVSTLQMLPFNISPTTSWATLVPLVSVLFVTFCKDAYEDLKRWRDDCRVNNQTCKASETCEDSTFTTVKWSQVQVGSFVKLHRDQPVPADLLRLGRRLCCVGIARPLDMATCRTGALVKSLTSHICSFRSFPRLDVERSYITK